ncbi:MAG: Obg family GTPase CgtA, partial [Firmicutes bacterium]|nr:Obg family GTPase CgtA [Bacillota bacterium]
DVPGLIEGAHTGAGLGREFLRHLERTRVLVHVVDTAGTEGRDPVRDYLNINAELALYKKELAGLPQVVAANKMDIPQALDNLGPLQEAAAKDGREVYPLSAVTGQGVEALLKRLVQMLAELPAHEVKPKAETIVYRPQQEEGFHLEREGGIFIIKGLAVEKLVAMTDFNQEQAVQRLQTILARMGVEDKLAEAGAQDGDEVRVGDYIFEYHRSL